MSEIKIGQKLREIRKAKGISGKMLENLSGIGQSTISRIELDQHSPSLDTLGRICKALDISITDLLDNESDNLPPDLLQLIEIAKKIPVEERKALNHYLQIRLKG